MKRTHIMIAVFFACILSPNLLFPILKTTADEGTGENRSLAAFPTLSLETIDTFPSGVEDWINDHAAFRNRFLSLNARLNLSLFQFGDSQDVIAGKRWLVLLHARKLCRGLPRHQPFFRRGTPDAGTQTPDRPRRLERKRHRIYLPVCSQ
ncbi:MAG: hypothetical protein ACLR8P_22265 [Clostridium fessum]